MKIKADTIQSAAVNQELRCEVTALEEALLESEDRFSQIAEQSRTILWEMDAHGLYTYISDLSAKVLGYRPEEIVGQKHFYDFHPEDGREAFKREVLEAFARSEAFVNLDNALKTKNGPVIWVTTNGIPVSDAKGALVGYRGSHTDISERKRAEAALRDSEQRFRAVLEGASDGFLLADVESMRFQLCNEAFCQMLGWNREETLRLSVFDIHPADSLDFVQKAFENIARGELRHVKDVPMKRRDGQVFLAEISANLVRLEGKTYAAGFFRDVTELRQMEERLKESEVKFRTMASAAKDAFILIDEAGCVSFWNAAAERMFGYSAEEICGQSVHETLAAQSYRDACRKGFPNFLSGGQGPVIGKTLELTAVRKDGTEFPIELSISFIHTTGKRHSLGILRDITDRKQAEDALRHARDELERRVESRTEELTRVDAKLSTEIAVRKRAQEEHRDLESKLHQVQRLESLTVLACGIAHDFNNLLLAVLGNAELALRRLPISSPIRGNLEDIRSAAETLEDLCQQMLVYAGRGTLVMEPVDLSAVVEEVRKILSISQSSKATVTYNLDRSVPRIDADRSQIQQVAMNLIINASDSLGGQPGTIRISTGVADRDKEFLISCLGNVDELTPGKYVHLEVSDTGCGMDASTRDRVFEPFFTTKPQRRGLGMAAVHGIVRQEKGAIRVDSEVGVGTTVLVLFPASHQVVETESPTVALITDSTLWQGTALVVDDEALVLRVASEMLTTLGFKVLKAQGGRAALEKFAQNPTEIRFILLDFCMPEMDGMETLRQLRQMKLESLVIVSSGYAERDCCRCFEGLGVSGFLKKPYQFDALRAKLLEVLGQPDRRPPGEPSESPAVLSGDRV